MQNSKSPETSRDSKRLPLNWREKARVIAAWLLLFTFLAIFVYLLRPNAQTANAMQTKAIADLTGIKTALDMFCVQNARYPTTAEGLAALAINPGNLEHWEPTMDKLPVDPWGHAYIYRCPGNTGGPYDLLSAGPDGKEGTADDITLNSK